MIRAAGPIGRPPERENDDIDWPSGAAEERVVSGRDSVGVGDKISRVLSAGSPSVGSTNTVTFPLGLTPTN
jgi:hypothetical protein